MKTQTMMYVGGGALFGGILGYLIVDYLIYKNLEKEFAEKSPVQEWMFEHAGDEMSVIPNIDYSRYSKADLGELSKPYLADMSPYVATLEDWNLLDIPKRTILYYTEDSVFSDGTGEIIKSPQNIFGPNAQLHFGEESEDEDVVYIHNPGLNLIYEIIRQHESYKVTVLGEEPPEKKDSPKREAREAGKKESEEKEEKPPVKPKRMRRAAPPQEEDKSEDVVDEESET